MISMDLNASPLPEEDEQPNEELVEDEIVVEEHQESAVETMRREREERRRRLKREIQDEGPKQVSQPTSDYTTQNRNLRPYRKAKELPQGWLNCPPHGQSIGLLDCPPPHGQFIGNIIPSKVPLDESYYDSVLPGKRYSPKKLTNQQMGREIGLVIDLTNTTRYYSPSEFTMQGIKHLKIPCKGRDAVPDNESVNVFVHEALQFLSRQKHSRKKHILVHCTHGHNRTGFMIIHLLVRTQLLHVAEAIYRFAEARPPGIYKQEYIEALYTSYHEVPDEHMIYPSTPEWKRSSEFDLNGEAMQDDDDDGDAAAIMHQDTESRTMTINDILGDAIPYGQQEAMRKICFQLMDAIPTGRGNAEFQGSHPVSLNRENLQLLRQRYYYATWKADGTRYMMLITTHGSYLIDRKFNFRRVQLRFPLKNVNEGFHNFTLIDGEMIIDTLPDTGLKKRRYLAYDLVALNSASVVKLPFSDRWKLLEKEIIQPRTDERKLLESRKKCNPVYRYDMEPFGVRRKDFWLLSTVYKLLKEFIPKLSHESDGLIFQACDDPYVTKTHEALLKWKFPEMNSVDFLLEVVNEDRQLLFLYERGKKKLLDGAEIKLSGECEGIEDVSSLSGKILECHWDQEIHSWVSMRVRTDKSTPNDINTYRKVMKSINDNITEEVLLNEIEEIVRLPMYAERIKEAERIKDAEKKAKQNAERRKTG